MQRTCVASVVALALALGPLWLAACPADDDFGSGIGGDDDTGDDDTGDDDTLEPDRGGPGQFTSIATDPANAVHIVHYALFWPQADPADTSGKLRYTTNGGGGWKPEDVANGAVLGAQTTLRLADEDHLHVSFFKDGSPAFALKEYVDWEVVKVDTTTVIDNASGYTALGLDGDGGVHLSYYDGDELVRAAPAVDGGWARETIATIENGNGDHDLAVDSTGTIHLLYYDADDGGLRHAYGTAGDWHIGAVDMDGDVGRHVSVVVDGDDRLHAVYRDVTENALRYATGVAGAWSVDIIDDVGEPGGWCTGLDLDDTGTVHVSYYVASSGDLRHASGGLGEWTMEVVDSAGDVGRYSSLAVDGAGAVHIAYQAWKTDEGISALKYATDRSGFWELELVEDPDDLD